MNNNVEIKIDSLAYGGEGIGRLEDGRVVFVPYVIPGELVRAQVVEEKAHHARARVVEVLEPAVERVQPTCAHFGTCGGCHYQHMRYDIQLTAKADILAEQLQRIGGMQEIPEVETSPSPLPWYYRNQVQFHLTREGKLGYQKAHSNQPFAIQECHLPEAGINHLWPQVEIEPMPKLQRISIRQGAAEELMIILESKSSEPVDFNIEGQALSVVQVDPMGSVVLVGREYITMDILDRQFSVNASSFFQVNSLQANSMVNLLLEQLRHDENITVLDVYAGVGLFSAFLAPKVKRLVAIEISPQACEDYTNNLDEFDNVELYEATAEEVLSNINFKPEVIVMDPPRAGLGSKTIEGLLTQGAQTLLYVSCDPATLARDAKQLAAGGYVLKKVTLLDMFPQTYHIESMCIWEKSS